MLNTRLHFFVTPRPITCMDKLYTPPKSETDMIKHVIELGYAPLVDSSRLCKKDLVSYQAWVWVEGDTELTDLSLYKSGRIFLLIYWVELITDEQFNAAKEYFENVLCLSKKSELMVEGTVSRMLDDDCFKPFRSSECIGGTEQVRFTTLPNGFQQVAVVKGGEFEKQVNEAIEKAKVTLLNLESKNKIKKIKNKKIKI